MERLFWPQEHEDERVFVRLEQRMNGIPSIGLCRKGAFHENEHVWRWDNCNNLLVDIFYYMGDGTMEENVVNSPQLHIAVSVRLAFLSSCCCCLSFVLSS